jgi:hypothetical protein
LLARVRSLLRLKMLTDELRLRAVTARDIGLDTLLSDKGDEGAQSRKSWSSTNALRPSSGWSSRCARVSRSFMRRSRKPP